MIINLTTYNALIERLKRTLCRDVMKDDYQLKHLQYTDRKTETNLVSGCSERCRRTSPDDWRTSPSNGEGCTEIRRSQELFKIHIICFFRIFNPLNKLTYFNFPNLLEFLKLTKLEKRSIVIQIYLKNGITSFTSSLKEIVVRLVDVHAFFLKSFVEVSLKQILTINRIRFSCNKKTHK